MVKLTNLIAPAFYSLHNDIKENKYTHWWLKGGRGSTKSSVVGIEKIKGIMEHPGTNGVAIRKVGLYLKDSVFEQLCWAIEMLGVSHLWHVKLSPLELVYIPTGQKILLRGADKPKKLKSTKVSKGYIRYIWYEEVDEFNSMEEIRTINQSLMRGGDKFDVFYTYNPPKSQRNWVNNEVLDPKPDKFVHHSTYETVPRHWLGEQFINEAEHLKATKPELYAHEYLGIVTGTGGEVFTNITVRPITDDEIKNFDRIYMGVDWGYYPDPFAWTKMHYDANRKRLYIFDELVLNKQGNRQTADALIKIKGVKPSDQLIADSAEPKSIADYRSYGLQCRGAVKGPNSVDYSMKWLQSLGEIIIDNTRAPVTTDEFLRYAYEKDREGKAISGYPDKDNHCIDSVRYSLNQVWTRRGQ